MFAGSTKITLKKDHQQNFSLNMKKKTTFQTEYIVILQELGLSRFWPLYFQDDSWFQYTFYSKREKSNLL